GAVCEPLDTIGDSRHWFVAYRQSKHTIFITRSPRSPSISRACNSALSIPTPTRSRTSPALMSSVPPKPTRLRPSPAYVHASPPADTDTARRLKNATSRAWHARRRLSRRAGEARYADGQARAEDDALDIIGAERGIERASDGMHARTCLGVRGLGELLDARYTHSHTDLSIGGSSPDPTPGVRVICRFSAFYRQGQESIYSKPDPDAYTCIRVIVILGLDLVDAYIKALPLVNLIIRESIQTSELLFKLSALVFFLNSLATLFVRKAAS
ncbi:Unknown protein, partial [Striga hermonthica]